ncbi:hypothetical protein JTE90_005309 [Oedothorax gibbosus]|uniref:Uncharacterized protein n=1 Tax=Oedothorax gibbosus TaxID=931172 RepID=A0AAV6UJZ6_9ARAC|nr:hypothetical protein JTE90_005309 [Oedothorax gibbosus]
MLQLRELANSFAIPQIPSGKDLHLGDRPSAAHIIPIRDLTLSCQQKKIEEIGGLGHVVGRIVKARYGDQFYDAKVLKIGSGKRVNFCSRNSYKARCFGPALSFNSKESKTHLHKTLYDDRSPGPRTQSKERKRIASREAKKNPKKRPVVGENNISPKN